MRVLRLFASLLLGAAVGLTQKPEYDFFPTFRNQFVPQARSEKPGITDDEILEQYSRVLRSQGVAETERERRFRLIRTERNQLEADYWDRFYLDAKSNFNRSPNGFLVEVVKGRRPGVALDYGMGEGRNALYLASRGWQTWGFDPAGAAVAMAQTRAKELGLTLHTVAVRDSEYEFGIEKFDLILFSWTMPLVPVQKVIEALKPGGVVVMECGADFTDRNGMLRLFDGLRIVRYEVVIAKSDFYGRRDVEVLRLIARKE